jgi:hypothetical protein
MYILNTTGSDLIIPTVPLRIAALKLIEHVESYFEMHVWRRRRVFIIVLYTIISVLSACGSISILEILLPAKACLIITIFPWDRARARLPLPRVCAPLTSCTERRELFLLLKG